MKFFLRHSWLYFILNLWESKHLDSEGYVKKKKEEEATADGNNLST